MIGLLARRFVSLILVIFGVTITTFLIGNVVPGDAAKLIAGPRAPAAQVEAIRHELGLDKSLPEQYVRYVERLAKFDLGRSIVSNRPIADELLVRIPATLELMFCALILAIALGVPMGVVAAVNKGRWPDHLIRGISVAGISIPAFWLALLLVLLFYAQLDLLPGSGRLGGDAPAFVTGFLLIDSLLAGDGSAFADALSHLVLPVLTLGLIDVGAVARLVRANMIDVLQEDYIRTARASGLREGLVVYRLALRNALIPLVTVLGLSIAQMLYGSVVIETVFGWPGTGSYVVQSIFNLDFPVIMGFTVLSSIAYVVVNLIVDLAYYALDPQIRGVG